MDPKGGGSGSEGDGSRELDGMEGSEDPRTHLDGSTSKREAMEGPTDRSSMRALTGPVLAVQPKKGTEVDLVGPVRRYIRRVCSEREADACQEDLESVQRLRQSVIRGKEGTQKSRKDLETYYRVLKVMETRFPFSDDKEQIDSVFFVWKDAFKNKEKTALRNIKAEQGAILFNLGATVSQQAIESDRDTEAGIKSACKHFQEAAGVFALIRQCGVAKIPAAGKDLSYESSTMLENLMLAQAQECFFVKATVDGRSPGICARLAKQAELFYREAINNTAKPAMKDRIDSEWLNHVSTKEGMMQAWSLYFLSLAHRAEEDIGKEIARLQAASTAVKKVKKDVGKKLQPGLVTALKSLEVTIQRALDQALKENSMIYLVRVPDPSSLEQAQGAPMVKSIRPEELFVPSEFFSSFVPDHCAKALSVYTDMVDRTVRELTEQLQETSDQARLKLRELELPELLFSLDSAPNGGYTPIPEPLSTELEELNSFGGVRGLQKMFAEQKEHRSSAISALGAAEATLMREFEEDAKVRQQFEQHYMLPKSDLMNHPLRERIEQFKKSLEVALDSDQGISSRLSRSEEAFRQLNLRDAAGKMPKITTPMVCIEEGDAAKVLQKELVELEGLALERDSLETQLRELRQKDNILPKLMSFSGPSDELFSTEIEKYDEIKGKVKDNGSKSKVLLEELAESYAKFCRTYDIVQWKVECEKAANLMRKDVESFRELKSSLDEGTSFYISLSKASSLIRQQCGEFALSRQLQRDEMVSEMRRRRTEEANRQFAMEQALHSHADARINLPGADLLNTQFSSIHVNHPHTTSDPQQYYSQPGQVYMPCPTGHQPQPAAGYAYPAVPSTEFAYQNPKAG